MTWQIEPQAHQIFARNPLAAVIVDLRFHPILKVPASVADFQERVRVAFPEYHEQAIQSVTVQPFGGVQISQDKVFAFRKSDGSGTLNLTQSALTLELRVHRHSAQLISELLVATEALGQLYAPVDVTRLGLRYVNFIDRQVVAKALGRDVEWSELISSKFLSVPTALATWEGTLYNIEVSSRMPEGELTLRYGLLRDPRDGVDRFRFDTDRSIEAPFAFHDIARYLEQFSLDAYSIFAHAKGPALDEWMLAKGVVDDEHG